MQQNESRTRSYKKAKYKTVKGNRYYRFNKKYYDYDTDIIINIVDIILLLDGLYGSDSDYDTDNLSASSEDDSVIEDYSSSSDSSYDSSSSDSSYDSSSSDSSYDSGSSDSSDD